MRRVLVTAQGTQTWLFRCSHLHLLKRHYRNTSCREGIQRVENDRNPGSSRSPGMPELMESWAPRHCQEEEHSSNKTQLCDVHATGIFMRWLMCTLSITWLQCKFPHTFIWEGKKFPQLSGLDWLSWIVLHSICGVSGSTFWIYFCICFCWVSSSTWNLEKSPL